MCRSHCEIFYKSTGKGRDGIIFQVVLFELQFVAANAHSRFVLRVLEIMMTMTRGEGVAEYFVLWVNPQPLPLLRSGGSKGRMSRTTTIPCYAVRRFSTVRDILQTTWHVGGLCLTLLWLFCWVFNGICYVKNGKEQRRKM